MNKRIILVVLSLVLLLLNCDYVNAQGKFYLHGTINKKFEGGYIKLFCKYKGFTGPVSIRSEIVDDKFSFEGEIDQEFEMVYFEVWKNGRTVSVNFFIAPDTSFIEIENIDKDPANNKICYIGIPFLEISNIYNEKIKVSYKNYLDYGEVISNVRKLKGEKAADSLKNHYAELRKVYIQENIDFIRNNPDSYFAMNIFLNVVLKRRELDSDSIIDIYRHFNPELKNTAIGKEAYQTLNKRIAVHLNKTLPNFTFKSIDERIISLSDFKGEKNVLICFWASWCKGCIENIPLLTQIERITETKGYR